MAGAGRQHKICKLQFTALVCMRWSKMAKIPKIFGTSKVKKSFRKRQNCKMRQVNATGQKLWIDRLNLWWRSSTMDKRLPPQAFCPPRRLLSKTWSQNNRYYAPLPPKEVPGRKPVCHEIKLQKYLMFVSENSARLNGGGGRLAQIFGRYVPQQNQRVDP